MLDGGTIRNIGLVLGSLIAFLLVGRFSFKFSMSTKDAAYFAAGGLLMGFGARFAKGCNWSVILCDEYFLSIRMGLLSCYVLRRYSKFEKYLRGKMSLIPKARN